MALGINLHPINIKDSGGLKFRLVEFTGDGAIPAAGTGYSVTKTELKFPSAVLFGITTAETTGVYFTTYDTATGKFRWFNADDAVEAANNEAAVNNKKVYGFFIGF